VCVCVCVCETEKAHTLKVWFRERKSAKDGNDYL